MKRVSGIIGWLFFLAAWTHADEIVMSWESHGVVMASGMVPVSSYTVEWASNLKNSFTNAPIFFDGLIADSNGVIRLEVPMFFRARIEVMAQIPAGVNSGTDPDFGAYSLTNASLLYMDETEVTKAQWDAVRTWALTNGYSFTNDGLGKATNHPVQTVSWYDCVKWCNARSQKEGRTPCYTTNGVVYKTGQNTNVACNFSVNGYRLPTGVEWEYAARGGLSGKRFPWGDTITHSQANYLSHEGDGYDISPTRGYHPTYGTGSQPYTSPVRSFAANGYGLYAMADNVSEWCWDSSGLGRGFRGGLWADWATNARCGGTRVFWYPPDGVYNYLGFRAVCR